MFVRGKLIASMTILSLLFCQISLAVDPETSFEQEESVIPKSPSVPHQVVRKSPTELPTCQRFFKCNGKRAEVDSNVGGDAERLKAFVKDTPAAVAEVNKYIENQNSVKSAAYIGTLGLLAAGIGLIMGSNRNLLVSNQFYIYGGLAIAGSSYVYAFTRLHMNEAHIENAVQYYNQTHPNTPIQLEFSTTLHF